MNKLDVVGVQKVRWDKGGTVRAEGLCFILRKRKNIFNCEEFFFVRHRIISAIKGVEFVSDRTSYSVLRGCWCIALF